MDMSRHDLRAGANDLPGSVVLTVHHVLVVAVLLLVRLRSGSGLHGVQYHPALVPREPLEVARHRRRRSLMRPTSAAAGWRDPVLGGCCGLGRLLPVRTYGRSLKGPLHIW